MPEVVRNNAVECHDDKIGVDNWRVVVILWQCQMEGKRHLRVPAFSGGFRRCSTAAQAEPPWPAGSHVTPGSILFTDEEDANVSGYRSHNSLRSASALG